MSLQPVFILSCGTKLAPKNTPMHAVIVLMIEIRMWSQHVSARVVKYHPIMKVFGIWL